MGKEQREGFFLKKSDVKVGMEQLEKVAKWISSKESHREEVGKNYKYEEGGLRLFMLYFRKVVFALTVLIFCSQFLSDLLIRIR